VLTQLESLNTYILTYFYMDSDLHYVDTYRSQVYIQFEMHFSQFVLAVRLHDLAESRDLQWQIFVCLISTLISAMQNNTKSERIN